MKKIVIYWKGWIWKSTTSTHLAIAFAKKWLKVLQVWCDPKHDSCKRILNWISEIPTVIDVSKNTEVDEFTKEMIIHKWRFWIDCIEAWWPIAWLWCAWRGISLMFEVFEELDLLNDKNYDVAIFDVLWDVVCWWFASPLKMWFADQIYIVLSEEIMSMYAANNISKAIVNYSRNWIWLAWVILNLRWNDSEIKVVKDFVNELWTDLVWVIPRSEGILKAERKNMTLFEFDENHNDLNNYKNLSEFILTNTNKIIPKTFTDKKFDDFIYDNFYK